MDIGAAKALGAALCMGIGAIGPAEKTKKSVARALFDTFEMFAWAMVVVFLLFTFTMRLCEVDGSSMINTLHDGESLLLYSLGYTPEQGDIVVFHLTELEGDHGLGSTEKTLVKRVIATGGQELFIDFTSKEIYVDGVRYEDAGAIFIDPLSGKEIAGYQGGPSGNPDYDPVTNTLRVTVPQHMLFVMGDNRNNSNDSRNPSLGFIDERCVLGKVVARLSPFTVFS